MSWCRRGVPAGLDILDEEGATSDEVSDVDVVHECTSAVSSPVRRQPSERSRTVNAAEVRRHLLEVEVEDVGDGLVVPERLRQE